MTDGFSEVSSSYRLVKILFNSLESRKVRLFFYHDALATYQTPTRMLCVYILGHHTFKGSLPPGQAPDCTLSSHVLMCTVAVRCS